MRASHRRASFCRRRPTPHRACFARSLQRSERLSHSRRSSGGIRADQPQHDQGPAVRRDRSSRCNAAKLTTDPRDSSTRGSSLQPIELFAYLLYRSRWDSGDVAVTLHLPRLALQWSGRSRTRFVTPPRSLTHASSDAQLVTVTVPADATPRIPRLQLRRSRHLRAARRNARDGATDGPGDHRPASAVAGRRRRPPRHLRG